MPFHAYFNQQYFLLINIMTKLFHQIGKHPTSTNQSERHENPSWSFQQGSYTQLVDTYLNSNDHLVIPVIISTDISSCTAKKK